jgi:predicted ATPase
MITEISLQNFKIFKDKTTFPLRSLNLLTGVNGGGKSTLLQSLLLMRQSIEYDERTTNIVFNGSCVELGTFMDVKNLETPTKELIILEFSVKIDTWEKKIRYEIEESISNDIGKILKIKVSGEKEIIRSKELIDYFNYTNTEKENYIFLHQLSPIHDMIYYGQPHDFPYNFFSTDTRYFGKGNHAASIDKIHYIAADRIGPKPYYEKTNLGKFPNVGPRGEHTANILYRFEDELVNDKLYLGKDAKTLMQQTEEWLKKILGGAKLELKGKDREHTVLNLLFNTQDSEGRYRPSNVGFGYTYILPIIVSGLIAKSGEILIVENPEAHLHPKAQSELTKFLALVASCGVQVFIESHSEHVLNAIRVATLKNEIEISNDNVSVLYFKNDKKEPFVHLKIDEKGKIDNWVDGFFDQQELDLGEIFKLSRKKK